MSDIFHRDLDAKSYGEYSNLTSQDKVEGLRLNPLDSVCKELDKSKTPLTVIKPLVESQNAVRLLESFSGSYVLWVYRNYRDVAQSNINKFGILNGINDLRPIVDNEPNNWRSEKVSESTREIVSTFFSEKMNPPDAHLLCWYARNVLFFEQSLKSHKNVIICRYEDLAVDPSKVVKAIYDRTGQKYPGDSIVSGTHSSSVGKGCDLVISPEVEELCTHLLGRLDAAFYAQDL